MPILSLNSKLFKPFRQLRHHFCSDSLFQNSIYLMLSTGVQAVFGFAFWLLVARLYTPTEVGLGSTLISAMVFISYLSLLGFNNTLVKYLPSSNSRSEKINSSLLLVTGAAFTASLVYVLFLPFFAPKLDFVTKSFSLSLAFIFISVFSAVNLLTDSIFIAYRAAKYNLLIYTIQSAAKLILPVALVILGAFGVFVSSGLAAAIALVLSLYFLAKRFDYSPRFFISKAVLKILWKFSSANYISSLFNILPTIVIPIIIVNKLGAAQAGYYYLAFMLANLLYAVAYSVSQSLFAEGSYGKTALRPLFKRATLILAAIMIPAGIALAFLGPFLLQIFGKSYGEEARQAIIMLALAAPFVAAYILSCVLLRITNRIYNLIATNIVYALIISGLVYLWVDRGLVWIALAWLIGNFVAAVVATSSIFYQRYRRTR